MKSTRKNLLIEIPPGRYVRAGPQGKPFKEISKPTQGLVVGDVVKSKDRDSYFRQVLVDGDLINWWSSEDNE